MNDGGLLSNGLSLLSQGGPMMYVILAMSIGALAIILAKLFQFQRLQLGQRTFVAEAVQALRAGNEAAADKILKESPNPIARVMEVAKATSRNRRLTSEDRDAQVSSAAVAQIADMTSYLRALELLANLSPLVGLLGTVTGMIQAFGQLELAGSQVDPSLLAGGIWEALLTTAFGLMVAIPAVAAFQLLDARVERIRGQMRNAAVAVIEIYHEQDLGARPDTRRATGGAALAAAGA